MARLRSEFLALNLSDSSVTADVLLRQEQDEEEDEEEDDRKEEDSDDDDEGDGYSE